MVSFLKQIWPGCLLSELIVIERALQLAGKDEIVRIAWAPTADPKSAETRLSVAHQLPSHLSGSEVRLNYFHGTNLYNLLSSCQCGLSVSHHGDGSFLHKLYTCKHRRSPMFTYSQTQELPITMMDGAVISRK